MQTRGTFSDLNSGMTKSAPSKQAFPAYYKRTGLARAHQPNGPQLPGKKRNRATGAGSNPFNAMLPMINRALRG